MKISTKWIGDYVDLSGVDLDKLIATFGLRTAEVEDVYKLGSDISGVVVARILSVEPHPKSNHLHKLKVDTGSQVLDVVCGAPNVRENMKVALATLGGCVKGTKIEKATIAGEQSFGMCCSKEELGFSENDQDIWEVDPSIPLGTDIKKVYDFDDVVFEVDNKSLTNRPDLWCHYGIAREISAILDRPLKPIITENLQYYAQNGDIDIKVLTDNCYRYSAIKIGNVTKKISPIGVQIRLFYCGMRAINLITDIANYVMLDVGQPMHTFDGDKVKNIQVDQVRQPLEFQTLDGEKRLLPENSTIICSNGQPVAVAGIMGGQDSEITDNTTSLLLESATFDSASVRKTAIKLGLRTEASARYEKSLDPELTTLAIGRFVHILRTVDPGVTIQSGLVDVYNKKYPERIITTTMEFINGYIGVELKPEQVGKILTNLGFRVDYNGSIMSIKVPSYRATKDVTIAVDIVEEIARMYGYDNIPQIPVVASLSPVEQSFEHELEYDTKKLLAEKFALSEVHTYIWDDEKTKKELAIQTDSFVKVLNSTVKDNDQIRSQLVPSLLKVVMDNKKYFSQTGVFEIGRVCVGLDQNNLAIEQKHLSIALYSTSQTEEQLYFSLKQMIENIAQTGLNQQVSYSLGTAKTLLAHPKNNAEIIINGTVVGYISLIHPKILQNMGKNSACAVLEVDFSLLASQKAPSKKMKSITKYQINSLDLNFVVDSTEIYQNIISVLSSYKTDLDYSIKLVDVYQDSLLLPNKKSMTFNFQISSATHTLSGDEIETFQQDMINLADKHGYKLRY